MVKKYLDDKSSTMETFFDFCIKQHDGKLLLTGNLKQADVVQTFRILLPRK